MSRLCGWPSTKSTWQKWSPKVHGMKYFTEHLFSPARNNDDSTALKFSWWYLRGTTRGMHFYGLQSRGLCGWPSTKSPSEFTPLWKPPNLPKCATLVLMIVFRKSRLLLKSWIYSLFIIIITSRISEIIHALYFFFSFRFARPLKICKDK